MFSHVIKYHPSTHMNLGACASPLGPFGGGAVIAGTKIFLVFRLMKGPNLHPFRGPELTIRAGGLKAAQVFRTATAMFLVC